MKPLAKALKAQDPKLIKIVEMTIQAYTPSTFDSRKQEVTMGRDVFNVLHLAALVGLEAIDDKIKDDDPIEVYRNSNPLT